MTSIKERLGQLYEFHGVSGILYAALVHLPLLGSFVRWWSSDHPWLGKMVERRNDIVKVDSCTFSVDAPAISREVKSRFLLNRYEKKEREALDRFLDPTLPVIELGASLGIVACLTNKKLADPSQHMVVEANPHLIDILSRNKAKNGCSFEVLHGAVSYNGEQTKFYLNESFVSGSANDETDRFVTVPTITLADVIDRSGFGRCTLISDIEGAEVDLVQKEGSVLARNVSTIILEIHPLITGYDSARSMLQDFRKLGFEERFKAGNVRVLENTSFQDRTQ